MLERFRKRFAGSKPPAALIGAPPVRRQKTYSAESGYVYQYFYLGYREADTPAGLATEYVFEISADRKTSFEVSIFAPETVLSGWCRENGRELAGNERYAVAKLALFEAFDTSPDPRTMHQDVTLDAAQLGRIAGTLDF